MEELDINMLYVLPTEPGMPPRCLLGHAEYGEGDDFRVPTPEELENSAMAVFSPDDGTWALAGKPLPQELAYAISAHARALGVPGF